MLYLIAETQAQLTTDTVILGKRHIYQNSFPALFKNPTKASAIWKKKLNQFQTNVPEKRFIA